MSDAAAAGMVGGMAVMMVFAVLVVWVLYIVARWKIFTKAGEAGWKSIIPIYSDYVQWRIGWNKIGLFWAMIACVLVGYLMISMSGFSTTTYAMTTGSVNMVLFGIGLLVFIAGAVLELISVYKLMQSFGCSVGLFVCYIFLNVVALMILGFGKSEYVGAQD